jgi:hypothetical protein
MCGGALRRGKKENDMHPIWWLALMACGSNASTQGAPGPSAAPAATVYTPADGAEVTCRAEAGYTYIEWMTEEMAPEVDFAVMPAGTTCDAKVPRARVETDAMSLEVHGVHGGALVGSDDFSVYLYDLSTGKPSWHVETIGRTSVKVKGASVTFDGVQVGECPSSDADQSAWRAACLAHLKSLTHPFLKKHNVSVEHLDTFECPDNRAWNMLGIDLTVSVDLGTKTWRAVSAACGEAS